MGVLGNIDCKGHGWHGRGLEKNRNMLCFKWQLESQPCTVWKVFFMPCHISTKRKKCEGAGDSSQVKLWTVLT